MQTYACDDLNVKGPHSQDALCQLPRQGKRLGKQEFQVLPSPGPRSQGESRIAKVRIRQRTEGFPAPLNLFRKPAVRRQVCLNGSLSPPTPPAPFPFPYGHRRGSLVRAAASCNWFSNPPSMKSIRAVINPAGGKFRGICLAGQAGLHRAATIAAIGRPESSGHRSNLCQIWQTLLDIASDISDTK